MMMKKITSLLLALMLVASLAACGGNNEPTEPEVTDPVETEPAQVATIDPVSYLQLSLQEAGQSMKILSAYPNEDGSVYVELVGEVTKKGNVDAAALNTITYCLEKSGLMELNGQSVYEDGEAMAGAYVTYGEDGYISADYTGKIDQAFIDAFTAMEDCFKELTADMAEYVPAPQEMGIISDADRLAINEILENMQIEGIDAFTIANLDTADSESFCYAAGLSSVEGVESALQFAPNMMTTPYSLVIVTLTDAANADAVAKDFENNIDWRKWVCVAPSNAAIAVKDNQVLCLIGGEDLYTQTITAIGEAGWAPVANLENPDM